ncbi:NAC domain-containing protein 83 [Citrus sinensis]|nr:NAC domain-containing protein 83 [Citrus sinensis]
MMVPKGFRFNPTDEELIQILESKVSGQQMPLHFSFIVERNLYELEPQQLQWDNTSALPENERYCYCMRENDSREVSGRGWWKATSHVKKIYATNNNGSCADVIGYKRPLTFHKFKDTRRNRSNAIKTNWIMHEYTLHSLSTDWTLCKIKYKGKPSVQEELEDIRNDYRLRVNNDFEASSSSSISVTNMDMQQHLADSVAEQQLQRQQQQPQPLQQLEQQQQYASYDPFSTQTMSTGYDYFNDHDHQLEQAHTSEQLFTTLWSWQ